MAQNLPIIGRLPNLGVKMDKNVYKNREPSSEMGKGWHLCIKLGKICSVKMSIFQFFTVVIAHYHISSLYFHRLRG